MKTRWVFIVLVLLAVVSLPLAVSAQDETPTGTDVEVTSGGQAYQSYLAAPAEGGPHPGIVLIHSFNGLEQGYKDMVDEFAGEGFVVLAIGWQTFERQPSDDAVKQVIQDSVAFLTAREDVDPERLGLTGFCAGGRYTMLLLPQMAEFKAGVAWYGFPTRGEPAPVDLVGDLAAPMLIIHGTEDEPSPIADIYGYAQTLDDAGKEFELKVYSGEPHGFMLEGGQLRTDEVAASAFREMADFFSRKLAAESM
ncbi:MAG: dienelactone hydrolase family protein [Anaerolineae bacterium]|nr:dienelactone hydrolase family protein [Anaerolineae bacterium]